jgi:pentatricopeptide repeat protein
MQKNSLYFFLIFICLGSVLSNYKVFDANIKQYLIQNYLSAGEVSNIELDYLNRISTRYPTLSSTVIPLKGITGSYWLENDSISKGLDLLEEANKNNPYLGFPDAMIAQFYEFIGAKDSFNHYARKAFEKLPNAPQHYVLISKTLVNENKIDSLESFFNNTKEKIIDHQLYKIYFAAAIKNKEKFDTVSLNQNIKFAKAAWPRQKDLRLLTDYLTFGEEKIKEIVYLQQMAIDSFELDPEFSIKTMENITTEISDNIYNYEILFEMYFKNSNYDKVITLYNDLSKRNILNFNAVIVEFISISYINTNNFTKGCSLARVLNDYNYKLSQSLLLACNINQN